MFLVNGVYNSMNKWLLLLWARNY